MESNSCIFRGYRGPCHSIFGGWNSPSETHLFSAIYKGYTQF